MQSLLTPLTMPTPPLSHSHSVVFMKLGWASVLTADAQWGGRGKQ